MFMQPQIMPAMPSIILSLVALAAGGIPILHTFKIIPFSIPAVPLLYEGMLALVGVVLLLDSLLGFTLA